MSMIDLSEYAKIRLVEFLVSGLITNAASQIEEPLNLDELDPN